MIQVNITDRCNLSCDHCSNGEPKGLDITVKQIDNGLKAIKTLFPDEEIESISLSGGEITLHPDLDEIIDYFADNDLPVTLMTNGVFAEKGLISSKEMQTSYKDIAKLFVNRMEEITERGIFNLKDDIKKHQKDRSIQKYEHKDYAYRMREILNSVVVTENMIDWIESIQRPMKNGKNAIEEVSIGGDSWHMQERAKRDYSQFSIFIDNKLVQTIEQITGVNIGRTQGENPAYIGRAERFKNFSKKRFYNYDRKMQLWIKRKTGISISDKKTHTELMDDLYRSNWVTMREDTFKTDNITLKLIGTCSCVYTPPSISPDGSVNRCTYDVLPAMVTPDGKFNPKFLKIQSIMHYYGGPLGLAMFARTPEKEIYDTFMDKGPCGLCADSMKKLEKRL